MSPKDFEYKLYRIHALIDPRPLVKSFTDYTERHRNIVVTLGDQVNITKRAMLHDLDKYEPSRLLAYSQYHYGEKTPEAIDAYNKSHAEHVISNEHHPQYWYNKSETMSFDAWLEMLCDWISAGRLHKDHYKTSDLLDWYLHDDRNLLDPLPSIRSCTEEFLKLYAEDINKFNYEVLTDLYYNRH